MDEAVRTPSRSGPRSRPILCALGGGVIVIGLIARFAIPGLPGDLLGGMLYATLLFLLVAFCAPRAHTVVIASIALLACVLVELFQLTPIPAALGEAFPPARLVLGSAFAPLDLWAYAAGVLVASAIDLLARSQSRRRP